MKRKILIALLCALPVVVLAGLETATYINQLNASYPTGTDPYSTTDDHLRLLKATIKNSFPNITGAMTATQGELNLLVGKTGTVWTSANDGAASTLDADLLDGNSSAFYLDSTNFTGTIADVRLSANVPLKNTAATLTANYNWSSGGVFVAGASVWHPGNDGAGSGLDADLLDGISSGSFYQPGANTVWTNANDGAASGLDADLLDGNSSAAFFNAGNLNAGSILDARVPLSAVSQHQASLTTRNISAKTGVTKTLSTSAASGGADGDIWYRY